MGGYGLQIKQLSDLPAAISVLPLVLRTEKKDKNPPDFSVDLSTFSTRGKRFPHWEPNNCLMNGNRISLAKFERYCRIAAAAATVLTSS